jgi:hypothetical protein
MLDRALVTLIALAAVAGGCGGSDRSASPAPPPPPLAQAQTRSFHEKGFATAVPEGWNQRKVVRAGDRIWFLNSGPGHADDYGLAAPGEIGLTIARQKAVRGQSASEALATIAQTPEGALGVTRSEPIKPAPLDGAEAATTRFTYTLDGTSYLQMNMVAIYRGTLVFIEVDAQPYDATGAERIMSTVVGNWRWKRPADSVVS